MKIEVSLKLNVKTNNWEAVWEFVDGEIIAAVGFTPADAMAKIMLQINWNDKVKGYI